MVGSEFVRAGLLLLLAATGSASPTTTSVVRGSAGCDKQQHGVKLNTRTPAKLPNGRTYLFWVPPTYNPHKATPLILSFHGATRTPASQADLDLLTTPFFNTDHIVAYPASGAYGVNQSTWWQGAPGVPPNVDDVAFALDVLDTLEDSLCIDKNRVYATGKSQGGMMTNNLACDARSAPRFAGFAPVSGSYYVDVGDGPACKPRALHFDCHPGRRDVPVPIKIFHGGNDHTIPFLGGPHNTECIPYIPYFASAWAARDGLSSKGRGVVKRPLRGAGDNATVYRYGGGWKGREEGDLVELVYAGDHVDHQWPATIPNSDSIEKMSPPATFNASSIIMDFFAGYTLRGPRRGGHGGH
ncbi:Alpha/Beta hydrolase protein [Nemania sp. FL0916]|nr:Alpha/Beta hydrolase protein [Nemania sp. FL0916]